MSISVSNTPGSPLPFGVTKTRRGVNFAVFSKNASKVTLLIYNTPVDIPQFEIVLDHKINRTGDVWHISLDGLPETFYYSYKLSGPNDPAKGLVFNEELELLDPYSTAFSSLETWNKRNNGEKLLNCYQNGSFDWEGDKPINRDLKDTIIYELHVRGFTRHNSSGVVHPGTYKGVIEKIGYLKQLGITAVELLPVHEFDETDCRYENPTTGQKLVNFWGYSSLNFFAVKAAYASNGNGLQAAYEFKEMVKALHNADIEVILDVVFNHTAEGGRDRPVYNFKGLENSVYYLLDEACDYLNHSGCGNTLNCNHPVVRKMIIDSLRFFVTEMHIDGFRFDLASILSRDENGDVMPNPPLLELIAKDPILAKTKIIAEAWDASGLYQVGSFPASKRWAEWNDRYRDLIRRFCKGESGLTAELATRIAGSEDLYKHSERNPFHSINFVTAHDGFTMMDLVSYKEKHNHENGEDNKDGVDGNHSLNFGIEGATQDPVIMNQRFKQIRNMATLLMLSQGTPMILSGDEFGNSQNGNNNAWCQDNSISWLDWGLTHSNADLLSFWRKLIAFRKQHRSLRRDRFFTGKVNPFSGLHDISWHNTSVADPGFNQWNRSLAFMIDGMEGDHIADDTLYVILNFNELDSEFELPFQHIASPWKLVLNTADPRSFIEDREIELESHQISLKVEAFSIVVLKRSTVAKDPFPITP